MRIPLITTLLFFGLGAFADTGTVKLYNSHFAKGVGAGRITPDPEFGLTYGYSDVVFTNASVPLEIREVLQHGCRVSYDVAVDGRQRPYAINIEILECP